MELLSVMFFGMMLQRTFMNMLQPTMELFGIFDLFRTMLMILFIPVIELLFPLFIKLIEWFIGLPEGVKLAIGIFALLGVILGSLLFIVGSVLLGLSGLILFFTGPLLVPVLGLLTVFMGVFVGITLIVVGIVRAVKGMADGIALILMGIGILLAVFGLWWAWIPLAIGAAALLIMKFWKPVEDFFNNLWKKIMGIFKSAWDWILTNIINPMLNNPFTGLIKAWGNIGKGVFSGFKSILGFGDFIWRSGQSPIAISPNDNIIGTQGGTPSGVNYSPNYYINVVDRNELDRMFREHDRNIVNEIGRMQRK